MEKTALGVCLDSALAPDIQRAIIEGKQPADLTLQQLINMKIPVAWADQRRVLGFDRGRGIPEMPKQIPDELA